MDIEVLYEFVNSRPHLKSLFLKKAQEHLPCMLGAEVVVSESNTKSNAKKVLLNHIRQNSGISSKRLLSHFSGWKRSFFYSALRDLKNSGSVEQVKTNGHGFTYSAKEN